MGKLHTCALVCRKSRIFPICQLRDWLLNGLSLFQISDIVVGQEDVSAKEALLRWARKTTDRYPGVKVSDFTSSWRDGLAFNAIIHRNRPDLVEWKKLDRRQVRERIDLAFHVMEKEYGVTRLLDPEGNMVFQASRNDEKRSWKWVLQSGQLVKDQRSSKKFYFHSKVKTFKIASLIVKMAPKRAAFEGCGNHWIT